MVKLYYLEPNTKRLYMEKNADVEQLYFLLIKENRTLDFLLKDLDCYKEHQCSWSCRKIDDSEMVDCSYIHKICKEIYDVDFSLVSFVDCHESENLGMIFEFYGIIELGR